MTFPSVLFYFILFFYRRHHYNDDQKYLNNKLANQLYRMPLRLSQRKSALSEIKFAIKSPVQTYQQTREKKKTVLNFN